MVLKKRPSGIFAPAPLKNLRWRPPRAQVRERHTGPSFHLEALIQKILGKRASQKTFLGFSGFKKTGVSQSEVTPATGSDLQRSTFRMCVQIRMCTGSLRSEDSQGLVLQLQASRLFSRPARPKHTCCWREAQSEDVTFDRFITSWRKALLLSLQNRGWKYKQTSPALPREFSCGACVVWLPVQQKVSSPASVCIKHEHNYVISLSSALSGCSSSLQTSAWSARSFEEREDVHAGSGCPSSPRSPVHTAVSHTLSLSRLYWVGSASVFHFSFLFPSPPKRDSKVQPGVKVGPKSPNSCQDSERSRPVPVRLRQRSLARCESARPPILLLKSLEPAAHW